MNQPDKILVIGARGQLGQEMVKQVEEKKIDCLHGDVEKFDITDYQVISKAIAEYKPTVVINCAAYNNVDGAEEDWQTAFMVNGIGVRNLALSCRENDCTLVHYSSDFVFDGQKETPYTIADQPNPLSKYGESKYLGEKFVVGLAGKYFLIRLSWLFGHNPEASFPLKLMGWAKDKDVLEIIDDQISSPAYVVDVARATLDLINTKQYGLYHMTNSGSCSKYQWAQHILKGIGWSGELKPVKSEKFNLPAKRPKYSVLDNFPLKDVIGYELPSWQEAVDNFLKTVKK